MADFERDINVEQAFRDLDVNQSRCRRTIDRCQHNSARDGLLRLCGTHEDSMKQLEFGLHQDGPQEILNGLFVWFQSQCFNRA